MWCEQASLHVIPVGDSHFPLASRLILSSKQLSAGHQITREWEWAPPGMGIQRGNPHGAGHIHCMYRLLLCALLVTAGRSAPQPALTEALWPVSTARQALRGELVLSLEPVARL